MPRWSAERRAPRVMGRGTPRHGVFGVPRHGTFMVRRSAPAPFRRSAPSGYSGGFFEGAGPCALAAAAKPPEAAEREGGALAAGRVNTVLRIHEVFARRGWGGAEEGIGSVAWSRRSPMSLRSIRARVGKW